MISETSIEMRNAFDDSAVRKQCLWPLRLPRFTIEVVEHPELRVNELSRRDGVFQRGLQGSRDEHGAITSILSDFPTLSRRRGPRFVATARHRGVKALSNQTWGRQSLVNPITLPPPSSQPSGDIVPFNGVVNSSSPE